MQADLRSTCTLLPLILEYVERDVVEVSARDPTSPPQTLNHRANDDFVAVIHFVKIPEVSRGLEPPHGRGRLQLPLHEPVVLTHVRVQACRGEAAAVVPAHERQQKDLLTQPVASTQPLTRVASAGSGAALRPR